MKRWRLSLGSGSRPLGLRREMLILLPVALVLLIGLSTFTLFTYRQSVSLLVEERQREAARLARRLAEGLSAGMPANAEALRRQAPEALGVALVDAEGRALAVGGALPPEGLLDPLGGRPVDRPLGLGPGDGLPESVAGIAPLGNAGGRRYVRVDLPARSLAAQRRSLPLLSAVVLGANGALGLLVLLFLRHLLRPWETLLERARRVGEPEAIGESDETAFLIATFERAVEALARAPETQETDDFSALERILSASLESGLLLLDGEGRVLAVNPVGSRLLGVSSPAPGTALEDLLGSQPEVAGILRRSVETRRGIRRQECTVTVGGTPLTLGMSVHPLRRDDGRLRGFLVLFADLTEIQRQAEESRLAESLARLGELAAGVAHELRNSLATLRGYLSLSERSPGAESTAEYLAEMRRETDHIGRVVEDFLSFARPGTIRVEEIRLGSLASRAMADPTLAAARVTLSDEGAGEIRLRGDPQLLERAVRNLLHNAAQAETESGREPPQVVLRLQEVEDGVELVIEDRGSGLPPEIRDRLFQPFASGRSGGVGLGLALSHRILQLHGGRLRLEDREGGGTRARIYFPSGTIVTQGNKISTSDSS